MNENELKEVLKNHIGYKVGYDVGQQSAACCGACAYYDNLSCESEQWDCMHEDVEDSVKPCSPPCEFFEPRRRKIDAGVLK